jgi:hypothetical protein
MSGAGFIQYPKWKHVTLPSVELPHIYKDPPHALWTRKKERVSEQDVMYMSRPDGEDSDPSRINEGIQYLQRGINPAVEIEYQNYNAGGSRTLHSSPGQVFNPYRVEVVRPPLFPVETTLPISRPRTHQTVAVTTNPGIPDGFVEPNLVGRIDKQEVLDKINIIRSSGIIPPTAVYKIQLPTEMYVEDHIKNPMTFSAVTGMVGTPNYDYARNIVKTPTPDGTIIISPIQTSATAPASNLLSDASDSSTRNQNVDTEIRKANLILENIQTNFSVLVYNPLTQGYSEIVGPIRDRQNIAVRSSLGLPIEIQTPNGQNIKLKDYQWKVVQSANSQDKLILELKTPNLELNRNIPLYAVNTNLQNTRYFDDASRYSEAIDQMELVRNRPLYSMTANKTSNLHDQDDQARWHHCNLDPKHQYVEFNNMGFYPSTERENGMPALNDRGYSLKQKAAHQMETRVF